MVHSVQETSQTVYVVTCTAGRGTMPKRKLDTSEFPVGALIVNGPVAKRLWEVIENDAQLAAGAPCSMQSCRVCRPFVRICVQVSGLENILLSIDCNMQQQESSSSSSKDFVTQCCQLKTPAQAAARQR